MYHYIREILDIRIYKYKYCWAVRNTPYEVFTPSRDLEAPLVGKGTHTCKGNDKIRHKTCIIIICIICRDARPAPPAHSGPKSLILAPQNIPDILGYQLGFGCQCVKAYNSENHVTNQKILQIHFVSNLDICKIVILCPGQQHVKAQV